MRWFGSSESRESTSLSDAEDEQALKEDLTNADDLRDLSVPLGIKINDPVRMYLRKLVEVI